MFASIHRRPAGGGMHEPSARNLDCGRHIFSRAPHSRTRAKGLLDELDRHDDQRPATPLLCLKSASKSAKKPSARHRESAEAVTPASPSGWRRYRG